MGFDVWEAMSLWGKRQREPRCQDPVSYQARKEGAEISMAQSCTLNVPARQQQKERPNEPCKQLVVDHEELSRNKKGTKKWVDFAEYQRLHGLEL